MAREFEHPTEALDLVMTQVMAPRFDYLCGVAASIMRLPKQDPRVQRCVASLQTQCLMAARDLPPAIEKNYVPEMRNLETTITHITEFSLGGMRAIAAAQ
jgi:hypothetical protein